MTKLSQQYTKIQSNLGEQHHLTMLTTKARQ